MVTPKNKTKWEKIDPEKMTAIEQETKKFWSVDPMTNATDYLEMMSHFLSMNQSPWRWKWVVLAAHQSLYTFMIMALSKTAPILHVTAPPRAGYAQMRSTGGWTAAQIATDMSSCEEKVTEKQVKKLLKKKLRLIGIWEAKERLTATEPNTGEPPNPDRNDYLPWSHSRRLVLTLEEEEAIEKLISVYRNEFEHFQPKAWVIDPAKFPPMISHVLRAIRFIALESNCIFYHRNEQEERVKAAIELAQQHLDGHTGSTNTP